MDKKNFDSFFKPYSQTVDKASEVSAFWRLSDEIITEIIKQEIAPYCTSEALIMDAGGGTGRWAVKLSEFLKGNIVVFDRSKDMLVKAQENIKRGGVSDRIKIVEGDLTDIKQFEDESIDHIVSIYSPMSFIDKQTKAVQELFRILKPNGRVLIMSHGHFNAIASKINNYQASSEELRNLVETRIVKWAKYVPPLVTHSKESIEELFLQQGFNILKTYGVPVFAQPGSEDFDPNNEKKSRISKYLEDRDTFKSVFEIEMQYNSCDTLANRGMNVFMLAQKK